MTKKRPPINSTPSLADRLTRLMALVSALGGLAAVVATQYDEIDRLCRKAGLCSPPPCVEITANFPETVEYAAWENQRIVLKARTNCPQPRGLYVTFRPRQTSAPFANLVPPFGNSRECRGHPARLQPSCWEWRKPIPGEEKEWEWNVLLPSLEPLRDRREVEQLQLQWEIRDYDSPTASAIAGATATISIVDRPADAAELGEAPVL